MNIKLTCLAVIVVLFSYTAPGSAELLFTEDWEAETVGDQIDQLTQWNPRGGSGSIMQESGGKFLHLNDPTPNNFSWVSSKETFGFADGNEVSLVSDITLRGDVDAPAKMGIRLDFSSYPRYNVAVYADRVELEELGPQNVVLGSLAVSVGVNQQHSISFVATHLGDSIDFGVFMDGGFLFSATDETPHMGVNDRFAIQLATAKPMLADFDNIQLRQVPEPSALVLFLVGGACFLVGLIHRGGKRSA